MNLIIKEQIDTCNFKVIIGDSNSLPDSLNNDEIALFNAFLETEDDFKIISDLSSTTYLIKSNSDKEKIRIAGAKVRSNLDRKVEEIAVHANEIFLYDFIEGLLLANYQFIRYFKSPEDKENTLHSIFVAQADKTKLDELNSIAKAVYWARDMVNEPVSFLTAEQLAEEIRLLGEDAKMNVNILEKSQIEALKMGGLLSVNKGSIDPPTFTIVEYKSPEATNKNPDCFSWKRCCL